MNTIDLQTKKKISLNILIELDAFCKKHHIEYFIAYGTLLGAVRHGGFIPWDDDVDIIMFRDDYNKFINIYNEMKENDCYKCLSFEKGTFYLPYSKVVDINTVTIRRGFVKTDEIGVGIDIFPFDFISDDFNECEKRIKKLLIPAKLLRYSLHNSYAEISDHFSLKYIFYILSKIIGYDRISKNLQVFIRKNSKTNCISKYVMSYSAVMCGDKGAYEYEIFKDPIRICFEGKEFVAPGKYDAFLRRRYGDYMVLPPENQRIQHYEEAYYKS